MEFSVALPRKTASISASPDVGRTIELTQSKVKKNIILVLTGDVMPVHYHRVLINYTV
jgi:hypothetical protein